jgi:outer membrane protein TolC
MARRSTPAARLTKLVQAATWLLAAQACSADSYRRDADNEVGEILTKKQRELFNRNTGFTVEQAKDTLRALMLVELANLRATRVSEHEKKFGPDLSPGGLAKEETSDEEARRIIEEIRRTRAKHLGKVEEAHASDLTPFEATDPPLLPARKLGLAEAVAIAADNNRDYQTQKEAVYTSALNLTFQRYLFDSQFGVTSQYDWTSADVNGTRTRDGILTTQFSMTRSLASGGLLVFNFTNSIIKTFTGINLTNGHNETTTASLMDISFSQPLLRGFGADIVEEPLVQSERNVYYQLRAFERFRQEFAVSVAREYMSLQSLLDRANNARTSYLQLIDVQEQSSAKGVRGRLPEIQVSQAKQAELSARNTWIQLQRGYQDAVDTFKLTLGLPMESNFAPDPADLEALRAKDPGPAPLDEGEATSIALEHRYDYQTELDRVADSKRQVKVTEDSLRTALGINAGVAIPNQSGSIGRLDGGSTTYRAGAAIDLPVDRLSERNNYRAALISLDAQQRATTLAEDQVRQDVRNDVRKLAQVLETIRLQHAALEVAIKREASTALQLAMGRSQIRDYTDAVDSLNNARNALTQALIDHRIGEYELSRDVGLLGLDASGVVPKFRPDPPVMTSEKKSEEGSQG